MNNILTATKARNDFFNILNRVIFGNEAVYVKKEGADSLVKIERVSKTESILDELAGCISDTDAKKMKDAIAEARTYPKRKLHSFD